MAMQYRIDRVERIERTVNVTVTWFDDPARFTQTQVLNFHTPDGATAAEFRSIVKAELVRIGQEYRGALVASVALDGVIGTPQPVP